MTDNYRILGLHRNATLDEIKLAWRTLALKYHPDRNKNSGSIEKFREITDAYEALINERVDIMYPYFSEVFTGKGKVEIGNTDNFSFVEIRYADNSFYGTLRISQNSHYSVIFRDGYFEMNRRIKDEVWLVEVDDLLWIKEIDKPTNAVVANNGIVAFLHKVITNRAMVDKDFIDLGGSLVVADKSGETLFTYEFGSNIEGCAISNDGDLVAVATLYPDNSIYFFDVRKKILLWKYKSHLQREPVLGLKFRGDELDVFTGHSIATMEKGYVLRLNGTLTPEYENKSDKLRKIKKQRPAEKVDSLLAMTASRDAKDIIEGLSQLASFAKTKGSTPHYTKIVNTLGNLLRREASLFEPTWKVLRQILKRQPEAVGPIVPDIISQIKRTTQIDSTWILSILGELGEPNSSWVKAEEQFIKQKLRSKDWNERRFAAFAIGSIGSADPSFVKDVIHLLIEYASDPDTVRKHLDELSGTPGTNTQMDFSISMSMGGDGAIWLRDACIDAIGMIGKRSPESVNAAVPLLEKLSKDASAPYTMKKAMKALEALGVTK